MVRDVSTYMRPKWDVATTSHAGCEAIYHIFFQFPDMNISLAKTPITSFYWKAFISNLYWLVGIQDSVILISTIFVFRKILEYCFFAESCDNMITLSSARKHLSFYIGRVWWYYYYGIHCSISMDTSLTVHLK